MTLAPVCILAGGYGTRLGAAVQDTPKPLLPVAGEPFLLHQLRTLARFGAKRAVLCVGYLGERIEQEIGHERFGIDVAYAYDPPQLSGTAGAIRGALALLDDRFLVLYGDTYLRIDYAAVDAAHARSGKLALMTVLRNDDRWDKSNVLFRDETIVRYDKASPGPEMHWIDYGLGVMTVAALESAPAYADLAGVYRDLAERGELAGYEATERFYEIGTPAALAETSAFLADIRQRDRS
ncbi:MAG TPA: sugar phosphate nucleotidyltransferase [Baekduia sp.]|nr:sugar phosphate nucleotidyltransferase [Baekduia sp.]